MKNLILIILLFVSLAKGNIIHGKTDTLVNSRNPQTNKIKNSIVTDPLLPLFNSFALVYESIHSKNNGFVLGFWYGKVTATYPKGLEYPGYAHNFAPILGYRRYFWKNLHAEYQLYPGYTNFFEENEGKHYHSFSLFTELRVGYKFDFNIKRLPLTLNLQWPIGTSLYESNEPDSFREILKQDPIFYLFFPNIYIGFRF
jgi:hypothetical protein